MPESMSDRVRRLSSIFSQREGGNGGNDGKPAIQPIPDNWILGRSASVAKSGGTEIEPVLCESWAALVPYWQQAMTWTEGLDRNLSVMLAVVASTPCIGDQLWVKIIGPPSTGKTTLAEALAVARKYVRCKSTFKGFFSGYQTDAAGREDHSLMAKLRDMTLIVKDGDTVLNLPNYREVMSQMRDIYDKNSRSDYKNKRSADYENYNITVIFCGTHAIKDIDETALGVRFIDSEIMKKIDPDLEYSILLHAAHQASADVEQVSTADATNPHGTRRQYDETLIAAMQHTGGYVEYLRQNAARLFQATSMPRWAEVECAKLGLFIAYIRAKPQKVSKTAGLQSVIQEDHFEREFAPRLVKQMVRLTRCLTVVLNRKEPDIEVMRRVRQVALDTCSGTVLELAHQLYAYGKDGIDPKTTAQVMTLKEGNVRAILNFMCRVSICERLVVRYSHIREGERYYMTSRMRKLYHDVIITPQSVQLSTINTPSSALYNPPSVSATKVVDHSPPTPTSNRFDIPDSTALDSLSNELSSAIAERASRFQEQVSQRTPNRTQPPSQPAHSEQEGQSEE